MNILGLKIASHDTGAAILSEGRVIAIAEERLNRVKHSYNMFPHLSIEYCLKALTLKPQDIGLVVIDQVHSKERVPMEKIFRKETGERFAHARIEVINHHDAHAASAFFCSPFEEAAVIVYDSAGEEFRSPLGVTVAETETLYYGSGNTLTELQKGLHTRLPQTKQFPYTFGVGRLYESITNYLGFGFYEEGKTMGLAPYGKPGIFNTIPEDRWWKEWHGQFFCSARIHFPKGLSSEKAGLVERVQFKVKALLHRTRVAAAGWLMGGNEIGKELFEAPLSLPRPRRPKSHVLPDDYYTDVAYAVQDVLETVVRGWARRAKSLTRTRYLCIAGGVGLNSVVNKKILDDGHFDDVWIQPGCSDTGIALGCALYGRHVILGEPRSWKMNHAYLGKTYTQEEIRQALDTHADDLVVRESTSVVSETAKLIAEGKIIGWFQGGSEYGPSALGNRSIVVDARVKNMKDILNDRVKHREGWRPFAASILKDYVEEYFAITKDAGANPYMLMVADVQKEKRDLVPSIVHIDGTCRVQTVTKEDNGRYFELIEAFYKETGTPLILNTSYNLGGEPIIESPEDAVVSFLKTNMDYLVMGDFIAQKKEHKA